MRGCDSVLRFFLNSFISFFSNCRVRTDKSIVARSYIWKKKQELEQFGIKMLLENISVEDSRFYFNATDDVPSARSMHNLRGNIFECTVWRSRGTYRAYVYIEDNINWELRARTPVAVRSHLLLLVLLVELRGLIYCTRGKKRVCRPFRTDPTDVVVSSC